MTTPYKYPSPQESTAEDIKAFITRRMKEEDANPKKVDVNFSEEDKQ